MKPARPRSYGRQAQGKTIKSLSLHAEVAAWAEAQAALQGVSFSRFMENALADRMQETADPAPPAPEPPARKVRYGPKKPPRKSGADD